MNKLKVLELFGGIGACSKALENLNIPFEIVDYVEIDKYAVKSFNAIHNTNFEPQDICTWDKDIEVDLIMHGSPCQDFSISGLGAGGDKGSGTRSSLMYETIRIVEKLNPKYVIWENVKNLLSKKHFHNFNNYLEEMDRLGYINFYQVLNAKDYGIPQNRERVFTISIRKDIKKDFIFPEKQILKLKLKDMLEDNVDEKYYLSNKMLNYCLSNSKSGNFNRSELFIKGIENIEKTGISRTLTTKEGTRATDIYVIGGYGKIGSTGQYHRQNRVYDNIVATSITTNFNPYYIENNIKDLKIRKLIPLETWLLMGFDKTDFEKVKNVNSDTQLYKQAGNSIVVNVLMAILKNLIE